MAVKDINVQYAYGLSNDLIPLPPLPIIAKRDPTANDIAQLSTMWINNSTSTAWVLTSVIANVANWVSSPVAGATILASLQVTGAGGIQVDTGDVDITLGDLNIAAGNATIAGNLNVGGITTLTGDLDLSSAALIDLTSTLNAAPSILLHANGGAAESIEIHSDQGTSVTSINIHSDVGGVTLLSGLSSADAINITANAAGGGIDVDAGTAGFIVDTTGAISFDGAAASNFSVTGAGIDLSLVSTAGSVIVNGGEAAADALRFLSAAGGMDANVALQMNLDSSQGAVNAIRLLASNVAGGIDIDSGTGGITLDSTGLLSIDAAGIANFTTTGAFDITLSSTLGSAIISGGEAVADAVQLAAGNAAGGVTVASGTGGFTVNSTNGIIALNSGTAAINIGADAVAHTITLGNSTGATSLVLNAGTGPINIGTNAIAHTTTIGNATGVSSVVIDVGTGALNLGTTATAHTTTLGSTTTTSSTVIQAGTGEVILSAAGAVSMVPAIATVASPTATAVINARVFKATFTGFTTAAAGLQAFTITNSVFGVGDGVFVTVANAGTNDAKMTLNRVDVTTAGTLVIHTVNNGAAALNGNVVITGWIID